MRKKLFLLATCFILFSSVTVFFIYRKRQLAEIARKEEEKEKEKEKKTPKEKNNVYQKEKNKIDNSYFFEKTSGKLTAVFILLLWSGYFFPHLEKEIKKKRMHIKKEEIKPMLKYSVYGKFVFFVLCALNSFFSQANSYGLSSLIIAIIIAFCGQIVIDFIVDHISYFLIKKDFLRLFKILRKREPIIFSSWLFFFTYLLYSFIIAIIVRIIYIKKNLNIKWKN